MDELVTEASSLSEIYGSDSDAKERFARLEAAFTKQFGSPPDLFVRSPGRVNLIGEHIDYEGYSVLPMAIGLDTIMAVRTNTELKLRIANVNPKYGLRTFEADPTQAVDLANHSWANYVICGYKGVFDYLAQQGKAAKPSQGLDLMVDGRVPTGSGLSSSAALVCASSLAVLASMGVSAPKAHVAELACVAERYIGTQSGGMDQAISIMGQRGLAKVVHFNPVRTEDVRLPAAAAFVIANSLAVSNKAETAHTRYNLRVVECRLAAAAMTLALGGDQQAARAVQTLGEVERSLGGLPAAAEAAAKHLKAEPYSSEELAALLGCSLEALFEGSAASQGVLANAGGRGFKLRDRAQHVFAEAARVGQFAAACAAGAALETVGALMDASHASCRDQYECSCAELEELVALAKAEGAIGARLTGAGWGGCAVMLVAADAAPRFVATLREKYYQRRIDSGALAPEDLPDAVFATEPAAGAAVLRIARS